MNPYKKWCIGTIVLTLVGLLTVAASIAIVDPYFHYHKPQAALYYNLTTSDYHNPGIVQHFDYDTLVIGTSMAAGFKVSLFKDYLGATAVKTIFPGGKTKNLTNLIDLALAANPNLKAIYLGLDLNLLDDEEPELPREPYPIYMYDTNPWNDAHYLLNKYVFVTGVGLAIVGTIEGLPPATFDDNTVWQDEDQLIGSQYENTILGHINTGQADSLSREKRLALAEAHLQGNILPLIIDNPEIEFVFFIPPYSILYWYNQNTDNILAVLEYTFETLLPYENVKVFFPLNDPEIVTNLYYYRDFGHYNSQVSDYLVRCFADDRYLLTAENYQEELQKMRELVEGFDGDFSR
jgi:hypothetical protein